MASTSDRPVAESGAFPCLGSEVVAYIGTSRQWGSKWHMVDGGADAASQGAAAP